MLTSPGRASLTRRTAAPFALPLQGPCGYLLQIATSSLDTTMHIPVPLVHPQVMTVSFVTAPPAFRFAVIWLFAPFSNKYPGAALS